MGAIVETALSRDELVLSRVAAALSLEDLR